MKNILKLTLAILAIICGQISYSMEQPKNTTPNNSMSVAAKVGTFWGINLVGTTIHELGHYAGFRMAGVESKDLKIRMSLHGLTGSVSINPETFKKMSKSAKCATIAAGPLAGALAYYGMLKLTHIYQASKTTDSFNDALHTGLKKPFLDTNSADEKMLYFQWMTTSQTTGQFINFYPTNNRFLGASDGHHIFTEIFSNHKPVTRQVARIAMKTASLLPISGYLAYILTK